MTRASIPLHRISMTAIFTLGGCLLAGFLGVFSNACSARVDPSELTGTYSVHYPFGHGSLHLGTNGQYEQVLEIGGRTASARAEWTYFEYSEGEGQGLLLQRCLSATNKFGELNPEWERPFDGGCGWSITRRFFLFGAIELADDAQYDYRKVLPSRSKGGSPAP
jgi:hypothetical protein